MENIYLTGEELPFCKGCGHSLITQNTEKAFQKLGLHPLDVILVTDIGCHGIIDKSFMTHTVHGLHGRSVALASGISAALCDTDKKIIVFMGDGSATIGMQHIIDAAHNNYNMTVVVHNNMLYGMTGGQPSEFTPQGFKTPTLPGGATHKNHNICELVKVAGANYVRRVIGIGDFSDYFAEAFAKKGFSLLEVIEICPSYGVKANPGMKIREIAEQAGMTAELFANEDKSPFSMMKNETSKSLVKPESLSIEQKFNSQLNGTFNIMLSGSAGEGVQAAAEVFAKAAISSGLHSTKKGSYPVTVGIGFSASEIIISSEPVVFTGLSVPDILLLTSADGLAYAVSYIRKMNENSVIYADNSLEIPETKAKVIKKDFRLKAGAKNSSIYAVYTCIKEQNIVPLDAFMHIIQNSRIGEKLDIQKIFN